MIELLPCPMCEKLPMDARKGDRLVLCPGACHSVISIVGKTDEHTRELWNAWVKGYNQYPPLESRNE
jgi:hypothetical protein